MCANYASSELKETITTLTWCSAATQCNSTFFIVVLVLVVVAVVLYTSQTIMQSDEGVQTALREIVSTAASLQ